MLLTKGLIKIVAVNLCLFNKLSSYLYRMDTSTYKLIANESKRFKFEMICQCIVAALMSVIMMLQLVYFRTKFHKVEDFEGIFNIGGIIAFLFSFYVFFTKRAQIVELFNMVVRFERKLLNGIK